MTESDDVLLGRAELERAFTALGDRLSRRGVVADIFIVGGAAMAMAYDATRVTRDVDARFVPHGIVADEARRVADDLGLPHWWLNEQEGASWPVPPHSVTQIATALGTRHLQIHLFTSPEQPT